MQVSTKLTLIEVLIEMLEEQAYVSKRFLQNDILRKRTFPDDAEFKHKYYEGVKKYLEALKLEKKTILFMLKHERSLYFNDVIRTLDYMQENCADKLLYVYDLIDSMEVACQMNEKYKFGTIKKVDMVQDINTYLSLAKGFSLDSVIDFLYDEEVLNDITEHKVMKNIKKVDAKGDDIELFSGVFDKGTMIAKVQDEKSTLAAIHEIVHQALLVNKHHLDRDVVMSESLPIFYEHLYMSRNKFIDLDIHEDKYADILLSTYDDEPMEEQAEKLRKLIK